MSTETEAKASNGRLVPRRLQLAILFAAISTAAAALVVGALYFAASREMARLELSALDSQARILSDIGDRTSAAALAATLPKTADDGTFYVVSDAGGQHLAGPRIIEWLPTEPAGHSGLITYVSDAEVSAAQAAQPKRAFAVTRPLRGGGSVTAARDTEAARSFAQTILISFLAGAFILATASIGIGLAMASALSRRLEGLTSAMEQIMTGDLGKRLPLAGYDDDMDGLVRQVNRMLDRIDLLMRGLKDVSDGIAHDLKTPLNRIRARVETALRDMRSEAEGETGLRKARAALEQTIDDADGLIRTFDALLLVARLEAKAVTQQADRVDLGALLGDVFELYEPLADEQGVKLSVIAPNDAPTVIVAHRQLVTQAIINLVENALKYARYVEDPVVTLTWRMCDDVVGIIVADNGPGIPEHERAHALKRFGRLDRSRTSAGFGLGLSLVSAVGELHGGRLRLEDNRPGLRAILELPAALDRAGATLRDAAAEA